MKHLQKVLALALCSFIVLGLAACGKGNDKKSDSESKPNESQSDTPAVDAAVTEVYHGMDLTPFVSFKEYKGMKFDLSKVEVGDVANIDYCGKKDGVAFQGGTAQGYDLTIGSGQFIPGFEDGLVGVKVGDTVDLDLKFPDKYQSEELAGAAVVFTVTVNSVKKPAVDNLVKLATVNSYPNDEKADQCALTVMLNAYYEKNMGATFETLMQYTGTDINGIIQQSLQGANVNDALSNLKNDADCRMALDRMLVCYALFQREGLSYDASALQNLTDYARYYEEEQLVEDAVTDFLMKYAVK